MARHTYVKLVKKDESKNYVWSSAVILYATDKGRKPGEHIKKGERCRSGRGRPDEKRPSEALEH